MVNTLVYLKISLITSHYKGVPLPRFTQSNNYSLRINYTQKIFIDTDKETKSTTTKNNDNRKSKTKQQIKKLQQRQKKQK